MSRPRATGRPVRYERSETMAVKLPKNHALLAAAAAMVTGRDRPNLLADAFEAYWAAMPEDKRKLAEDIAVNNLGAQKPA